jgi:hypothetical protein
MKKGQGKRATNPKAVAVLDRDVWVRLPKGTKVTQTLLERGYFIHAPSKREAIR